MILTSKNNTYYTLILDTKDLENFNINIVKFLGNSHETLETISTILKKIKNDANIKSFNITSFKFNIFKINIVSDS